MYPVIQLGPPIRLPHRALPVLAEEPLNPPHPLVPEVVAGEPLNPQLQVEAEMLELVEAPAQFPRGFQGLLPEEVAQVGRRPVRLVCLLRNLANQPKLPSFYLTECPLRFRTCWWLCVL